MLSNLVGFEWLAGQLNNEKVRICDCRFILSSPSEGFTAYLQDHIPSAVYLDLERDLSSQVTTHGGRHPLPDVADFAEKLGAAGIDAEVTVIAYDDQGGAMAARLWWLLRYFGHEKTYVLNGSYSSWKERGYDTTEAIPQFQKREFQAVAMQSMLASVRQVREAITTENIQLIDSREQLRYLGIEEGIDKKAGHIPGAKHYFWKSSLTDAGEWHSAEELKERFKALNSENEIIVYCGSGVTACPNYLVLDALGFNKLRLYAGSWSDWISYNENPIATGEE